MSHDHEAAVAAPAPLPLRMLATFLERLTPESGIGRATLEAAAAQGHGARITVHDALARAGVVAEAAPLCRVQASGMTCRVGRRLDPDAPPVDSPCTPGGWW